MSILDDIAAAKMKAIQDWIEEGARGSLHMKQVMAAEDVVVAGLEKMRAGMAKHREPGLELKTEQREAGDGVVPLSPGGPTSPQDESR